MSSQPVPSTLDVRTQVSNLDRGTNQPRSPGSKLREVKKGEVLFELGDAIVPFFVLLSGSMEIVQPDPTGEGPLVTRGPGGFTGAMTIISARRSLVRGLMTEPGEFLELSAESLRSLVAKDAELSEIVRVLYVSFGE
jgi:CRP-like cAMP-binding protein